MLTLLQVRVGQPELIGYYRDRRPVYSSIRKRLVDMSELYLTHTGLQGDQQTDTGFIHDKQVHGGHLKAVYAYPQEHYEQWHLQFPDLDFSAGLGENICVAGMTEHNVHEGDSFHWGETLLRVTVPRRPCFKLGMFISPKVAAAMVKNGRCGWYFSVERAGVVPTRGELRLIHRDLERPTIAEMFAQKMEANPEIPGMRTTL